MYTSSKESIHIEKLSDYVQQRDLSSTQSAVALYKALEPWAWKYKDNLIQQEISTTTA